MILKGSREPSDIRFGIRECVQGICRYWLVQSYFLFSSTMWPVLIPGSWALWPSWESVLFAECAYSVHIRAVKKFAYSAGDQESNTERSNQGRSWREMATHSVFLAWRTSMRQEPWWATVLSAVQSRFTAKHMLYAWVRHKGAKHGHDVLVSLGVN